MRTVVIAAVGAFALLAIGKAWAVQGAVDEDREARRLQARLFFIRSERGDKGMIISNPKYPADLSLVFPEGEMDQNIFAAVSSSLSKQSEEAEKAIAVLDEQCGLADRQVAHLRAAITLQQSRAQRKLRQAIIAASNTRWWDKAKRKELVSELDEIGSELVLRTWNEESLFYRVLPNVLNSRQLEALKQLCFSDLVAGIKQDIPVTHDQEKELLILLARQVQHPWDCRYFGRQLKVFRQLRLEELSNIFSAEQLDLLGPERTVRPVPRRFSPTSDK